MVCSRPDGIHKCISKISVTLEAVQHKKAKVIISWVNGFKVYRRLVPELELCLVSC